MSLQKRFWKKRGWHWYRDKPLAKPMVISTGCLARRGMDVLAEGMALINEFIEEL